MKSPSIVEGVIVKQIQQRTDIVRAFIVIATLLAVYAGRADVKLPSIFSDHMVLQSAEQAPVWGQADASEDVAVTFNGHSYTAKAGAEGRWMLFIHLKDTPAGPFEMQVSGKNRIVIRDVAVGQVWLASGQSNMERMLKQTAGAEREIAGSANPLIRQFKIPRTAAEAPARDCTGEWVLAGPATAAEFTAVGYYFAKRLHADLGVPVGIINATWGGTFSEAWTSAGGIAQIPSLASGNDLRKKLRQEYPGQIKTFAEQFTAWLRETGRADRPFDPAPFLAEPVGPEGWVSVTLPGKVAAPGLPECGAFWLRREVDVPAAAIPAGLNVLFGELKGFETVYWNGKKITETTLEQFTGEGMPRLCGIAPQRIKPGKNTLALRVFAPAEAPSFRSNPQAFNAGAASLAGTWQAKAEFALPKLVSPPPPKPPRRPVSQLASEPFNGMIAPIIPYRLAGVIWYQGEANRGRAWEYREAFPLLVKDWRKQWGREDLPFYFCQLANFLEKKDAPSESEWAETREAQSLALALPATGQAVLIDIGEAKDIHPLNKRDVGERLARIALARDYGKSIVFSGPVYRSMTVEGKTIRVTFSHAERGLAARQLPARYDVRMQTGETAPLIRNSPGSELEGFAVCGADRKWVWANAKIEGDSAVVWSGAVQKPVAVRYGWADNPTCNLINGDGLPAAPFRTDDFPLITKGNVFGPTS